ncbi:hypothetical protein RAS_04830 [Rickettsia asiatica]|uniref:N-acetyltransferase domain-containing protein n=1 Tax=Rickettsia asiatica TaxID=238800 RepID=A0A510G9L4_9RICK|nr:GNAT family N-acetyltransferase [Rickettsia asiatica]BBJ31374.1 hypothetical protein RAS_04830 [Rickettsia asiatica]
MLEHFQNGKYTDFGDVPGMVYELKDYSKQNMDNKNRHLSKPAYREEFKGDTSPRTAAYTNVHEDLSTGSMYKLPLEAKFGKMSNIRIITGIEEYKEWIRVLIRSFGFSDDVYNIYFDNLSKFIGDNKVFIPLTAYEENKIVATASIIFANGIAGFYHDSTMPEYRNRGLASDLYIARSKILKEMGIDKVIIQTSPMATSLAEKLGFKKYTNYKIYCQS